MKTGAAGISGLVVTGIASADDHVECPDCLAPHNINDIQIEEAIPPRVSGFATLSQSCSNQTWDVRIYVDNELVKEDAVTINCLETETVDFEYQPSKPLRPGSYELTISIERPPPFIGGNEETKPFQVPFQSKKRERGR